MKIKLLKMVIRNFKGIKDLSIDFSEKTEIFGKNGVGKTSVNDAFNWVLYNKNSVGETKFDIRPKDEDGVDIDFVDIYVALQMEVDGKVLGIEKTQKQKWVKKQNAENKTFDGNVNSFVVNTIPKTETEFKKFMAGLVDENVFKFVSNTNTFMSQKSADRRKTLFELVANIGVDEIVASEDKLIPILSELKAHDYEELKSRTKKAISEYKKKQIEIPTRIDEVSRDIVEQDYSEIEKELEKLELELEEIKSPEDNSEMFEKINGLNVEMFETRNKATAIEKALSEEKLMRLNDIGIELSNAKDKANGVNTALLRKNNEIMSIGSTLEQKTKEIKSLGADLEKEKLLEFDNSKLVCPVCSSDFSEDKKAEMIAKFEKNKADAIAKINTNGSAMKQEILDLRQKLADAGVDKANLEKELVEVTALFEKKSKEMATVKEIDIDFTKDKEWVKLSAEIEKLTTDIAFAKTLVTDSADAKKEVAEKRQVVKSKIDNAKAMLNGKQKIEDAKNRVIELKAELREIDGLLTNQEGFAYLLELFNKTKVNLLSDRINDHFNIVKWQLFRPMVNGGEEECCEPMVNGKPYTTALNSGHKILAELDIINALQKIYDCQVPVFLDNAERVNSFNVPDMDCQLIVLRVADNDVLEIKEV